MASFFRFACFGMMCLAFVGTTKASLTLSFSPSPVELGPTAMTGTVDVLWTSDGADTVGSFNLDLQAINFMGAASSVQIDSFTADSSLGFLAFGPNSPPNTTIPPNPFTIAGLTTSNPTVTTTASRLGTFAFTLSAPLTPNVDSFQFDFADVPDPNPQTKGIFSTTGTQLLVGSTPVTVTAVPEPSSMALCGVLLVAGVGGRAFRRRRNRKSVALAC